jgi:nonsense-mediated mRNA decay protein 3
MLSRANFNNEAFESLDPSRIPDVILVKKTYPNRRKKNRTRNWKLKSIAIEAEDVPSTGADKVLGRGALGRRGGLDQQKVEKDYEMFLRELEEDPELRSSINLYKAATAAAAAAAGEEGGDQGDASMGGVVNANGSTPGSGLAGGKSRRKDKRKAAFAMDVEEEAEEEPMPRAGEVDNDDDDDDEDFPDIELDELLEHFDEMAVRDYTYSADTRGDEPEEDD